MRIFSKKAFRFTLGEKSCQVKPLSFNDVDDWVGETDLFVLALKDRSIEVIKNAVSQKELENNAMTDEEKQIRQKAKELGIKNSGRMGLDKLITEIDAAERESENDSGE